VNTNTLGKILSVILAAGIIVAVTDECLQIYRGWTNENGAEVPGYALYERNIASKRLAEMMSKITPQFLRDSIIKKERTWEFVDFYQWEFMCDWYKKRKQSIWIREREQKIEIKTSAREDSPPLLYGPDELPLTRYECVPTKMHYRKGMGWGLF